MTQETSLKVNKTDDFLNKKVNKKGGADLKVAQKVETPRGHLLKGSSFRKPETSKKRESCKKLLKGKLVNYGTVQPIETR